MRKQADLLKRRPWRTLIVPDATRADMAGLVERGISTVRSLQCPTWKWCKEFWERFDFPQVWLTANPEPSLTWRKVGFPDFVEMRGLWRHYWEEIGDPPLGTVPPESVNAAVLDYVEEHGQPDRMVVFYLQPHAPYIAEPRLPVCAGNIAQGPTGKVGWAIADALAAGKFTWKELRASYLANLRMVWAYAERLAQALDGLSVITSDHGESLGECGEYGHAGAHWNGLRWVPWKEVV